MRRNKARSSSSESSDDNSSYRAKKDKAFRSANIKRAADNYKAKKVTVFQNGSDNTTGRRFVASQVAYPTLEAFLDHIGSSLDLRWTVTGLHTIRGRKVKTMADLQEGGEYVAVGGKFIRKQYGKQPQMQWKATGQVRDWPQGNSRPEKKLGSVSGSWDDGYESDSLSRKLRTLSITPKKSNRKEVSAANQRRSKSQEPGKSQKKQTHRKKQVNDEEELMRPRRHRSLKR